MQGHAGFLSLAVAISRTIAGGKFSRGVTSRMPSNHFGRAHSQLVAVSISKLSAYMLRYRSSMGEPLLGRRTLGAYG